MINQMSSSRPATGMSPDHANSKGTVLLFGEVLADIFPDRTVLGGAPFNVARHLKAFGQNPVLITRLGSDALRKEVLQAMSQYEMETMGVQCDDIRPTGRVQVHMEEGGHRFEILPMQAYDFIHTEAVQKIAISLHPEMVYYGTLAQRNEISRKALENLLLGTNAVKFLDINLRTPWYDEKTIRESLQYANIVKLNDDELSILAEMFELTGNSIDDQAVDLMSRFELERTVITCGEEGAWQIDRGGDKIAVGVKNKITNLVDTVGAGDGFAAVCILGSLKGWTAITALERAIAFAGTICEIRGAIPSHPDFYKPYIREWGL